MTTNSFYNHTSGVPVSFTRGVSSLIRYEFDLIQTGFNGVTTALAAKAAVDSQAFTGTPSLPSGTTGVTQAASDSSTKLATTAFVAAAAFASVLPGQSGNAGKWLTTDGTNASWGTPSVGVNQGGTGITSYAVGDIVYASGSTTLDKLAAVATGNVLLSGGVTTAPAWGKVGLTTHVNGTLPPANGGTGATTLTGVVVGNGTGAFTAVTAPSGTIVGTSDAQSLTNKTLQDATTAFADEANATKKFKFQAGGITAGQTRVITVQDKDHTLASLDANTYTGDQTLGNNHIKTIKTATFNPPPTLTTTTGAVTVDWSAAQNYKQNEPTGIITYSFTAPPGPCHLQLIVESDGTSTAYTHVFPGTVIWYGLTWAQVANKRAVLNFWWDGTNYHATGMNQV